MPRETGRTGYKAALISKLERLFPDCRVASQDPKDSHQGIPDLVVFNGPFWGMLEVKASLNSPYEPNQEYWIAHYNEKGFAMMICPENEEEVLHALQLALSPSGATRNSKR